MAWRPRSVLLLPVLLSQLCCVEPCPAVPVKLAASQLAWSDGEWATVPVEVGDRTVPMLLDTGFSRSAIGAGVASGLDATSAVLFVGGAQAGPLPLQVLLGSEGPAGVVGADVLHQLPLILDARARTAEILPRFQRPTSPSVLELVYRDRCGSEGDRHAPTFLVEGAVDGEPVRWVLDTGAQVSFITRQLAALLSERPTLEGIPISSGFAGVFAASATRVRSLSVGEEAVANAAVFFSPQVDEELSRLGATGFLGWNFLREFKVALTELSAAGDRRLGLSRFDTSHHLRRELVGIGIATRPSTAPPGLLVAAFFSVSPAREAGLRLGDLIEEVDGQPALQAPSPFAAAGVSVRLGIRRGEERLVLLVTVADLLPDPTPG